MRKFIAIISLLLCCSAIAMAADKKFTLVIDAGHGGKDPGTRGKTCREKDIALKTALAFGRYVEANCPDVKVIYTRKTDVFVELQERADIANRNHADLFVSIHVNSVASKKPITGIEVYSQGMRRSDEKLSAAQRENSVILLEKDYQQRYKGYDPNSTESDILFDMMFDKFMENSVEISRCIQSRLKSAGRPGRVKQDNFAVLRLTALPACLVELGYVTTPSEETYMSNSANLDKMAFAIYQGFLDYRKKFSNASPIHVAPTAIPEEPVTVSEPIATTVAEEQVAEVPTENIQATADQSDAPVFKVQLLVSQRKLKPNDKQFKGITNCEYYEEGGLVKYTTGSSTDYNAIYRLRKQVLTKFPQAFIIAFRGGEKMDVQQAIQEFKRNKK